MNLENHLPRIRGVPKQQAFPGEDHPSFSRRTPPRFEGHRHPQNFVSDPSLGSHLKSGTYKMFDVRRKNRLSGFMGSRFWALLLAPS